MSICEPPSALSIREGDEAYCPVWRQLAPLIDVMLNGVRQTRVIAYDADKGWVHYYRSDDAGGMLVIGDMPAEAITTGCVDVRWKAQG